MNKKISIIVAIDKQNAIGNKGDQLCYISEDLKRFRILTTGHTIVMGHKTQQALPKGFLPNRRNIVLSHDPHLTIENVEVMHSVEEVMNTIPNNDITYVIGGAKVYSLFFDYADTLEVTEIDYTFDEADTHFPAISKETWQITDVSDIRTDEKYGLKYRYVTYKRIPSTI